MLFCFYVLICGLKYCLVGSQRSFSFRAVLSSNKSDILSKKITLYRRPAGFPRTSAIFGHSQMEKLNFPVVHTWADPTGSNGLGFVTHREVASALWLPFWKV